MTRLFPLVVALTLLVACVSPRAASPAADRNAASTAPAAAPCPASPTADAILRKHEAEYGSAAAAYASLPRTFRGEVRTPGLSGSVTLYLERARHRLEVRRGGTDSERPYRAFLARGVDDGGAWEMPLNGAVGRASGEDAEDAVFLGWLFRREYLRTRPTAISCELSGTPVMWMSFPAGTPGRSFRLSFDMATAGVTGYELARRGEGRTCRTAAESSGPTGFSFTIACTPEERAGGTIEEWSRKDASGVRFPSRLVLTGALKEAISFDEGSPGLRCGAPDCAAMVRPAFETSWPPSGVVVVPMVSYGSELFVRVRVDGKKTWALFDSGAGMTAFDSTMPLGRAIPVAFSTGAVGSTQTLESGVAEVGLLEVGELTMAHLPVAIIPIPALAAFAATRPDVVLGLPHFQTGAVRIDYEEQEIVFARDASLLPGRDVELPLALSRGRLVTSAVVEGHEEPFQIDTGDANPVSLEQAWVTSNGLADVATLPQTSALSGAGTAETKTAKLVLKEVSLGPLRAQNAVADISIDAPEAVGVAGRIGNGLLASCAAVTFDLPHKKLWLSLPCKQAVDSTRRGIGFSTLLSYLPGYEDTPWVIGEIAPGSALDRAGVKPGDRILAVNGRPLTLSLGMLKRATRGPAGTVVTFEVLRGIRTLTLRAVRTEGSEGS